MALLTPCWPLPKVLSVMSYSTVGIVRRSSATCRFDRLVRQDYPTPAVGKAPRKRISPEEVGTDERTHPPPHHSRRRRRSADSRAPEAPARGRGLPRGPRRRRAPRRPAGAQRETRPDDRGRAYAVRERARLRLGADHRLVHALGARHLHDRTLGAAQPRRKPRLRLPG